MELGVGVGGEGQGRQATRHNIDAELFRQLPDQRRLGRLPGIDLATGKFPQPGHWFARRAAGEQDTAVGVHERHRRDQHDPGFSCGSCH